MVIYACYSWEKPYFEKEMGWKGTQKGAGNLIVYRLVTDH
jgi:hypothetical protein